MTSTNVNATVLKPDTIGRVRVPRERREQLLDEFERSGLSGAKFAALCVVKYPSFANWVQRRRKQWLEKSAGSGEFKAPEEVRWLEAVMDKGGVEGGALVVHLAGGARLEIGGLAQVPLAVELLKGMAATAAATPEAYVEF